MSSWGVYYKSYKIYGDPDESMTMMAHFTDAWLLCDNALFKDSPMLKSELEYNQCLLEVNQCMAYQGVLDNCHNVGITETDLQEA